MATKTAVCPECGSEAAPGRFACPACGALLASVGGFDPVPSVEPGPLPAEWAEPAPDLEPEDDLELEAEGDVEPEADLQPEPVAAAAAVRAPVWPPDGDRGAVARPASRTPAGAYLSPTAVLAQPDPPPATAPTHDHQPDSATARRLPRLSLAETLGSLGIADDVSRHLIAAGSAIAALGFLLPWASVLAGTGLGGTYWTRWGLAGPGHWVIVLALLGLVGLAVASGRGGRMARIPLGPIAVVAAAILIGLLWPTCSGLERFVGVWLVLAGTRPSAAGASSACAVTIPWGRPSRASRSGGPRPGPCYTAPDAGPPPGGRDPPAARCADGRTEARSNRMDQIFSGIGDAVTGFFSNAAVQLVIQAIAVYLIILWLAGAYWAFRDMQQRSENPILPYVAASFVILFTPIFFPLAIFVYKIVRPHEKIGETYERNLAEEALLAEVEAIKSCPTCARRVNEEWIICPTCRTRLNRVCPNCSRLVGLDWSLCAWCGKDFERPASALAASTGGRPAPITPLPAADDPTRLGRAADPAFADPERKTGPTERAAGAAPPPRAPRRQHRPPGGMTGPNEASRLRNRHRRRQTPSSPAPPESNAPPDGARSRHGCTVSPG